jgi:hypothetical protein
VEELMVSSGCLVWVELVHVGVQMGEEIVSAGKLVLFEREIVLVDRWTVHL